MTPKDQAKSVGGHALLVWLPVLAIIGFIFSGYLCIGLIGLTLAVVSYPLYRTLCGFVHASGRVGPSLYRAKALAALITESAVGIAVLLGFVLPLTVLYQNRFLLASHGMGFYGLSMDWGRTQMNTLGTYLTLGGGGDLSDAAASHSTPNAALTNFWSAVSDPSSLLPFAMNTAASIAVAVIHLMVLVMMMHVGLLHGPDFWEHIVEHTPNGWVPTLQRLGQRTKKILWATYVVQSVTAFAAFLVALPVFWAILGKPNFLLAAVLCGIFQLIPFLGSGFLIFGFFAYFFFKGQETLAWECLCLALPLVAGVADLVVRPALAHSLGGISGITMLVGFVAGMEAFGWAGFVLGPLILELFVCFTAIMLYGPEYRESILTP